MCLRIVPQSFSMFIMCFKMRILVTHNLLLWLYRGMLLFDVISKCFLLGINNFSVSTFYSSLSFHLINISCSYFF